MNSFHTAPLFAGFVLGVVHLLVASMVPIVAATADSSLLTTNGSFQTTPESAAFSEPTLLPHAVSELCGGIKWMQDYGELHRQRVAEGGRTLLLDFEPFGCSGLGNAMHVMMHWMGIAYLLSRAFLVRALPACDLSVYYRSPFFNWTADTRSSRWETRTLVVAAYSINRHQARGMRKMLATERLADIWEADLTTVIADTLNAEPQLEALIRNRHAASRVASSPALQLPYKLRASCLHHMLFQPTDRLQKQVNPYIQTMETFGSPTVGMHVRIGDTTSGVVPKGIVPHHDHRQPVRWECVERVVKDAARQPLYVASDSLQFITDAKSRFGGVFSSPGKPQHTTYIKHLSDDAMLKIVVDFEVLCQTDVRLLSLKSTFSQAVWVCALGRNSTAINSPICEPFRRFV